MKKILLGVSVLAVLGAAGFLAFWFWRNGRVAERLLPEDTFVYASISNIREAGRDWQESRLGKAIAESPRREVYIRLIERADKAIESLIGADPRPFAKQLTGAAAIGIFPIPGGHGGLGIIAYADSPDDLRKYIEQQIDPGWRRRDPSLKKEVVSEKDFTYYKYSSKRFPSTFQPCYSLLDHHLVVAGNEASMKTMMGVRFGKARSLRQSRLFGEAKSQIDYKRGLLLYVNPQSFRQSIEHNLPQRAELFWPQVVKVTGFASLRYVTYWLRIEDGDFRGRGFAAVDEKERSGLVKVLMNRPPRKFQGAANVPEKAQFFYSATLPDFASLDQAIGADWSRLWLFVQAFTGMDFKRDLLETLGEEATFFSESPEMVPELEQSSPIIKPKWAGLVAIRDPSRFGKTLTQLSGLAESRGIELMREPYGGAVINQFQLRYGGFELAPAYIWQQPWFFAGANGQILKDAIDTRKKGNSLMATQVCREAMAGFPAETNAISCTRVSELLNSYAALLRARARADEPWIREYGLDEEMAYLAKKVNGAASYSLVQKKGIAYESRSSVPSGFLALPPLAAQLPEILKLK